MAYTFHDDGKARLCCGFEDNFESRMTQIEEEEDDQDMPFMIQSHPHGPILRHLLNTVNSFLCFSTNYFENRLLPNELIIVRNHEDDE
jgi:hypothetical protein